LGLKLRVKLMGLEAGGKLIAILNHDDAEEMGAHSQGRLNVSFKGEQATAIINTARRYVEKGEIGVFHELAERLKVKEGDFVDVQISKPPRSTAYIKNRLAGRKLSREEIFEIVKDVVSGSLSEIEIAAFVTSLCHHSLDLEEALNLSLAMVETGKTLEFNSGLKVVDKHSIGGVPGDKTTLIVVPIIAAYGLTIPKCSSRAITSAAGTADRAETLMPVEFTLEDVKKIVEKTSGCIVWGGALQLSPADDIFIQVEFPLSIDPLLLPSIMSKKKAIGSRYVVIDIPCGLGAKIKTLNQANLLARDFIELGSRLGMKVRCAVTYGSQPVGYAIGPALEAREALTNLMQGFGSPDLLDKATDIAGMMIEMVGGGDGKAEAISLLETGKAERKLREIIEAQGGNPDIKPENIPIGEHAFTVKSDMSGYILWIDNDAVVDIARSAGAPKDKGAGVQLNRKVGDPVKAGDPLFTIYAEKESRLDQALSTLQASKPIGVGERMEMLMSVVKAPEITLEKFILER
jgi:AMP phosphorylase